MKRGRDDLAALLGEVIPVSKKCVPVQAADLVCWYTRNRKTLDADDSRRFQHLLNGRRPMISDANDQTIDELVEMFQASDEAGDDDADEARVVAG